MEVDVVDVTTETTSEFTEMVSSWGLGLEWVATAATKAELSASVGGEAEGVHDVTVSSEDVGDVFIRAEFNDFFLATLPVAAKVLASFNNDVWSEDEVVSFPSEDEFVVVVDGEFPDLVGAWWEFGKDLVIAERNGVTVSLSSLEFSFLEGASCLEDWLNDQVEVVDVSTETSLKHGEVLAERSMGFEGITSLATEFEASALVGFEAEVVEDISVSTEESGQEFISSEFDAFFLDTRVDVGSEVLVALDDDVWSEDEVVSLETEDELVVVPDSEVADLVNTTIRLEKSLIAEVLGVTVSLSSEELVSGWLEWLESTDPRKSVNV